MFEQSAPEALHDRPDYLTVHRQRIYDPANILDSNIVNHLDVASSRVNRDVRGKDGNGSDNQRF